MSKYFESALSVQRRPTQCSPASHKNVDNAATLNTMAYYGDLCDHLFSKFTAFTLGLTFNVRRNDGKAIQSAISL